MLDAVEDTNVASVRIEGRPDQDGREEAIDFDITNHEGRRLTAAQVKTRTLGSSVTAAQAFGVLLQLIDSAEADQYLLLIGGAPADSAQNLHDILSSGAQHSDISSRLSDLLSNAPSKSALLDNLSVDKVARLARCRLIFDLRTDIEIRQSLRERLRVFRNRASKGLGDQSAGMLTGYLVSEVLRRAVDESEAVFTIEQLRRHLLVNSETLARVFGTRDWGVIVGPMCFIPDVHRHYYMSRISVALSTGDERVRSVALTGLSGTGKSSLAAAYVADQADLYEIIFWIDSSTADSLASSFRRALHYLTPRQGETIYQLPSEQVRDLFHSELSRLPGRWALIFDGVVNQREVNYWVPRAGTGNIIFTTLDAAAQYGSATVINVGTMEPKEAVELLSRRLGSEESTAAPQTGFQLLAQTMSYWPLALELAAGYMNSCGIPVNDVDLYLEQLKLRALRDEQSLPPGYPRTLTAALLMSMDRLKQRIEEDTQDIRPFMAFGILTFSSYLSSRQMPLHLLAASVMSDPDPESGMGPFYVDPSIVHLGEVIRELRRFSLVALDEEIPATGYEKLGNSNSTLSVNTIVQDVVRATHARNEVLAETLNRLANHVERWMQSSLELNLLDRASIMFGHARVLAQHLHRLGIVGPRVALLYGNLAGAYRAYSEPRMADSLLRLELETLHHLSQRSDDGLSESEELVQVQAKLALLDLRFDMPGHSSLEMQEVAEYLAEVLAYAQRIEDTYPKAAVKFCLDVEIILERPSAEQARETHFHDILNGFAALRERLGPTDYSLSVDKVRRANDLIGENRPLLAEKLCRDVLKSELLTGSLELFAHRVLIESLARQGRWVDARRACADFRHLFGRSSFYIDVVGQFANNFGKLCAWAVFADATSDASPCLADLVEWFSIIREADAIPEELVARIDLFLAVRELSLGRAASGADLLDKVRPAALGGETEDESRAWSALWQFARLAEFRLQTAEYETEA
ncbi:NB-ARC domain-containing protein [Paractinoplanes brasiliensis]|nr:NB-ARC domain-containing protein [Actinoplanes brasiliensis]